MTANSPLTFAASVIDSVSFSLTSRVDHETVHGVLERVSFSFNKISVQYTPQGKDGSGLGAMEYTDQFDDAQ